MGPMMRAREPISREPNVPGVRPASRISPTAPISQEDLVCGVHKGMHQGQPAGNHSPDVWKEVETVSAGASGSAARARWPETMGVPGYRPAKWEWQWTWAGESRDRKEVFSVSVQHKVYAQESREFQEQEQASLSSARRPAGTPSGGIPERPATPTRRAALTQFGFRLAISGWPLPEER